MYPMALWVNISFYLGSLSKFKERDAGFYENCLDCEAGTQDSLLALVAW